MDDLLDAIELELAYVLAARVYQRRYQEVLTRKDYAAKLLTD